MLQVLYPVHVLLGWWRVWSDALFVWLMRDHTPRYTIDEVCTDSRKKMAVCVHSVMVGLLRPPQRCVFCAPHAMTEFLSKWCSFHLAHARSYSQMYYRWGLYWQPEGNGRMCPQRHGWATAPQRCVLFFCGPHTMTEFLSKWCSFCLAHVSSYSQIYYRWGMYWQLKENGRMCQQRHGRPTATIPEVSFVFVAPLLWQNSCTYDALFIQLMHDSTPKGTIDEVCLNSWKKMAAYVDRIMVGLAQPFPVVSFCGLHAMMKFFVQMMLFSFSSCTLFPTVIY